MFTKMPTDESLRMLQDKMTVDSSLEEYTSIPIDSMKMFTFCVKMTYFEDRLAMGSSLYWPTYTWNTLKKWH